jgi:hypothetical protein
MARLLLCCASLLIAASTLGVAAQTDPSLAFLEWTRQRAEEIGRSMREDGRVGGAFDLRVIRTERSYNYKLRATLMTPEVIRATARLAQLSTALTKDETVGLVREAEAAGDLVVMLEIDPREGSGVVPLDWVVLLRPKDGTEDSAIRGTVVPRLRSVRALAGTFRRDYAYEQLWAVFPLKDERGGALVAPGVTHLEVVVRIHDKEAECPGRSRIPSV